MTHRGPLRLGAVLVLATLLTNASTATAQTHNLGTVSFPVSCTAAAQVVFNDAMALLHHMTYPSAQEAFVRVAEMDPTCAMAHWGIAMTLFQPLWPTRPGPSELRHGWDEVQRAHALAPPTARESLFVAAADSFFVNPSSTDYWARIQRWEKAMERLYTVFPQDAEAATLYALAHLATAPSGDVSSEHAERAASILMTVYKQNPDHPGATHYLIHANDAPGREHNSLDIVRGYERIAPRNPHALHMPTHIYTRLGDWDAVIRGNLKAADAALEHPAGDRGQYVWDEFPHATEYLVYAYLQRGEDEQALAEVNRLRKTKRLQPTFKTAFHLASTQARYCLERHAWSDAARIVPRQFAALDWDQYWWPEAVSWFARGLGAAHEGVLDTTRAAVTRLSQLEEDASQGGENLFARNIAILQLELRAWLAHAEHQEQLSVELMGKAVDLEESTPKHAVTPAPTLPAPELLGDLLLEQNRPADALAAYQRSLDHYPRRFNSLLGAARAAHASKDETLARSYYAQLLDQASDSSRESVLHEARSATESR